MWPWSQLLCPVPETKGFGPKSRCGMQRSSVKWFIKHKVTKVNKSSPKMQLNPKGLRQNTRSKKEKGRNAAHRDHSHNELTRTEREQTDFNTQGSEDYQDTGETNQSRQSLRGKRTMAGNVKWDKTRYSDNIGSSKHQYKLQIKNSDTQNTQKNKQTQSQKSQSLNLRIMKSDSNIPAYKLESHWEKIFGSNI